MTLNNSLIKITNHLFGEIKIKKTIIFFIIFFNMAQLFSIQEFSFIPLSDNSNDSVTSATKDNSLFDRNITNINIAHGIISGITYAALIADCILGTIILYDFFYNNSLTSPSTNNLLLSHRILSLGTFILLTSSMIMAYITLGTKIYYKKPINIAHFASSIVTSSLFLLEIISAFVTGFAFSNNNPYAKQIGLAHGILSYTLLLSYTISIITLPLGMSKKSVL